MAPGNHSTLPARLATLFIALALTLTAGCVQPWPDAEPWQATPNGRLSELALANTPTPSLEAPHSAAAPTRRPTRDPSLPIYTPTPDSPHSLPTPRTEAAVYSVRWGDSLAAIAQWFGVSVNAIVQENELENPNLLEVGQVLTIPPQRPLPPGPALKLIPDSEVVNGPAALELDIEPFIAQAGGYLGSYREEVDEVELSGAQIVARVSSEFSVNPRLLLAILEYQSGWVANPHPDDPETDYPIGYRNAAYKGLYLQLSWTANNLNRGYYLWKIGGLGLYLLPDDSAIPPAETLNAGTVAVQHLFSLLYDQWGWQQAISEDGFVQTYIQFFGLPFDYDISPLVPPDLTQPALQLPFEPGVNWYFTGGPHGGWGTGSAWAALDFAPDGEELGCYLSDAWVTAAADGLIVRAENGAVVQDLNGDGYEQTGWTLLYMHIDNNERVQAGAYLRAGERIGHPSCEGGISNGTHIHLARRYNGEWVAADQSIPFNLEGWISTGDGSEYDGWLSYDGSSIEAWNGRDPKNQIHR